MPGFLVFTNGAEGLIDPQPEGQAGVDHQSEPFFRPGRDVQYDEIPWVCPKGCKVEHGIA